VAGALLLTVIVGRVASGGAPIPEERIIDTVRSAITVRVSAAGPGSAGRREFVIGVPLLEGSFEPSIPHMQLSIDARRMRVLQGGASATERRAVQARMLGADVLDVDQFPWISFHSITIEQSVREWRLHGELGLHGQVHPATVTVIPGHNRYTGSTMIRQSDYGIVPVTLAGGAIAVKDDVTIDFDIVIAEDATP
jgi:hypothetical protein